MAAAGGAVSRGRRTATCLLAHAIKARRADGLSASGSYLRVPLRAGRWTVIARWGTGDKTSRLEHLSGQIEARLPAPAWAKALRVHAFS